MSMTVRSTSNLAGDLRIYSAPKALLRHIQWSMNKIFEGVVVLDWVNQPLAPGSMSCELQWRSGNPLASKIAGTLKSWHFIRFEVREYPLTVNDAVGEGVLYRCTPDLGLHQAVTSSTGDVMVHENRLQTIMDTHRNYEALQSALAGALGHSWDQELEWYRRGIVRDSSNISINM